MEHGPEHRVSQERMHESYREREDRFRQQAAELWKAENALRERVRGRTDLSDEERMDAYREGYEGLEGRFGSLVEGFSRDISARVVAAEKTLFAGKNEHFADMLTRAAQTPSDQLESLFNSARRAGLADLAQAAAHVAYERDPTRRPKIFQAWAEADPQRAEALEIIHRTPGGVQIHDRTERALRPPKADVRSLEPTYEDKERAREKANAAAASRQSFFNLPSTPIRRVGRRVS